MNRYPSAPLADDSGVWSRDELLDEMLAEEPHRPRGWRDELAAAVEVVGCKVAVWTWDLAAAIRGGGRAS